MMLRRNGLLAILLWSSASCSATLPVSVTPTIRSEWFYPESKTWTPIEQLPGIDAHAFDSLKGKLRIAYDKTDFHSKGNSDCIIAALLDEKARGSFRMADVNLDGITDVLYSGEAFCQEGDVTLIWYGAGKEYYIRLDHIWPLRALKIHIADDPDISTFAVGCCGDMVDGYSSGKLENPRLGGLVRIYRDTADPLSASEEYHPFQNAAETVLRSSPRELDMYDSNASGREDRAVFGNVLSKYLAGASGRILFTQRAENRSIWAYVIMRKEANPLRYYVGYDVNVGWVKLQLDTKK